MNIIEAVKSGKPDRLKGDTKFFTADLGPHVPLTLSAILADDWEVEEKKVEITRDSLGKAFSFCLQKDLSVDQYLAVHWEDLCKELGL